jgi:hypothetical protein
LAAQEIDEYNNASPDLLGLERHLNESTFTAARGASISGMIEIAGLRI